MLGASEASDFTLSLPSLYTQIHMQRVSSGLFLSVWKMDGSVMAGLNWTKD